MNIIKYKDTGAAVYDIQSRLNKVGLLDSSFINGNFDKETSDAIINFCKEFNIKTRDYCDDEVWNTLVNESYSLGDRTLYLRMPNFSGADCKQLQKILGTLGFSVGVEDGVFGALTESALRHFQQNLGLPSDGIVGAYTYQAIKSLQHSWEGKSSYNSSRNLGYVRAFNVLENNKVCLFGRDEFSRSVAKRMSNLSLATTPTSKIVSADALSVVPDSDTLLFEIQTLDTNHNNNYSEITFIYKDDDTLVSRITEALSQARIQQINRIGCIIENISWLDAKEERSAQHYAVQLLDALCLSLA